MFEFLNSPGFIEIFRTLRFIFIFVSVIFLILIIIFLWRAQYFRSKLTSYKWYLDKGDSEEENQ